jgi:purine-binding chemotaxis protein CheW
MLEPQCRISAQARTCSQYFPLHAFGILSSRITPTLRTRTDSDGSIEVQIKFPMTNQAEDGFGFDIGDIEAASETSIGDDIDERARRDLIIARCGTVSFGVFADEAEAIIDWKTPIPLPRSPSAIVGVISARGRILTILDPIELLDDAQKDAFETNLVIGLRSDEQLGLAVEQVERIVEVVLDDVLRPTVADQDMLVQGEVQVGDALIRILDTSALFAAATRGAARRRQRS